MKTIKELFLESFGEKTNAGNTEIIRLDSHIQISPIKNGLAINHNKCQIFFFEFNEEEDTHELISVLDRNKFDSDMIYYGEQPHEYIETEEEYKEWLEQQRKPFQEELQRIEMYCLALKLENNLKEKNTKTKKTKL